MNISELARQFKEEAGSSVLLTTLIPRIGANRHKIHKMNEFDMETKVKMLFALSVPINAEFLIELMKVADVKIDDFQRIIQYKQKDGELELSAKSMKLSMDQGEDRNQSIIEFLAEKTATTDKPVADRALVREFKEKSGCTDTIKALETRYQRVKHTICQIPGIYKNTKIKMMFISNVKLSDETLKELRKDADVEVDEEGRITRYNANDGSLDLEGSHGLSSITKSVHSNPWKNICQNIGNDASEEDERDDWNWQKDYEKKQINLVKFLIERTKKAISPLSITSLAKDYKTEFKSSDNIQTTESRIRSFRQRIHTMNQLDIHTKVNLAFALSTSIDANFLEDLQKDAIVELDETQRIKKYSANDLRLNLEGDHSFSAKISSGHAERKKKKARVFNDWSNPDDSEFAISQSLAAVPKGRKRAREITEKDDEDTLKLEDDWSMDFDANNADDFDYDPSKYELDMEHIPIEKKPESLLEVKTEESSTTIVGSDYEDWMIWMTWSISQKRRSRKVSQKSN